ncbi:UvrABC system protein C [Porphyromonas levii]|uniref:excinuclease ABC subunit UvrC n=1 Tax=Porphyromonas levii TaxID=28114 RepID=UPI001BAC9A10|nr:excinuclease ABC subunit UvrC [Porphyromonas levii]MBR8762909.1 UvrABC system protein C [Porphyromonas levii]
MIIRKEEIQESLSVIPEKPGCYTYRDSAGVVIYVGKAKNLRKRVSSYFQKNHSDRKVRALIRAFATIEYMVVETELDALLLENNLIKQHQPHYNILLKEGDLYPHICVKKEPFPRVFVTFKVIRDGSLYFGPYPNKGMAWTLINLFNRIFKFRTCSLKLNEQQIEEGKFRACLKYHINRCQAPCEGLQSKESYDESIRQAIEILRGNICYVRGILEESMAQASKDLDFERAMELQHTLQEISSYQAKSTIISNVIGNALVVSAASDLDAYYVNYLEVHNGNIIAGRTLEFKRQLMDDDDPESDFLSTAIVQLLNETNFKVRELILEEAPSFGDFSHLTITIPQRGEKRKVLELSQQNVQQYMKDKHRQSEKMNPEQRNTQILRELMSAVGLPKLPYHVESFDNSNIQGSDPVASCIVFKGAKPSKKDYRLYKIRGVSGPDDYASMHEVVTRRYRRMIEEEQPLPDLIVTDGGKGQMGVVKAALREVGADIPVMGLAKDDRHNTNQVLYGDPPQVVGIMQRSQVFYLLERIQNEVHRFAITYHRKLRSKRQTQSALDEIPGIGPAYKQRLLKSFKSVKNIRSASLEQLQESIGVAKGQTVYNYFREQQE